MRPGSVPPAMNYISDVPTVDSLIRSNSHFEAKTKPMVPVQRRISQIDIENSKKDFVSFIKIEKH